MEDVVKSLSWVDQIAGFVWLILTIIMVFILVRIYNLKGAKNQYFYLGIFLLIIVWLYPLYTSSYSNLIAGELGNVFTLIVTIYYFLALRKLQKPLSTLMIPQMIWLTIATFYVGLQIL